MYRDLGPGATAYERERVATLERERERLDRMIEAEQKRRSEIQRRLEVEIKRLEALRH